MKRKIPFTKEEKIIRDRLIRQAYQESELTLDRIGDMFNLSKQLISIILKRK